MPRDSESHTIRWNPCGAELAHCYNAVNAQVGREHEETLRTHAELDFELIQRCTSLSEFDNLSTARLMGFRCGSDYYRVASAGLHLSQIRTPTVFLTARNDPLVPYAFSCPTRSSSPAFISRPSAFNPMGIPTAAATPPPTTRLPCSACVSQRVHLPKRQLRDERPPRRVLHRRGGAPQPLAGAGLALQHATDDSSMQHATGNMQHATVNSATCAATRNEHRTTGNKHRTACSVQQ